MSITEEFGVRARANKVNPVGINVVDEQEVAPDMAFMVVCPFPFQAVIQSLWGNGCVIGNEQQHGLLESHHRIGQRINTWVGRPRSVMNTGPLLAAGLASFA
jgi:hypothetical protein